MDNTPSTTNLGGEEIVDAPGKDGNASMPEQVKRPNPWRKMMMMMIIVHNIMQFLILDICIFLTHVSISLQCNILGSLIFMQGGLR